MLSTLQQGCIPANPDIAGIGIRASTYAQNIWGVLLATYYLIDGDISPAEAENIETASNAILVTGCAIIISAFIQAKTIGLSAYHALIVLNLSWMNNSYLVISGIFSYPTEGLFKRQRLRTRDPEEGKITSPRSQHEAKKWKKSRIAICLGLVHLSLMGGFGIWLWQDFDTFGDPSECTPYILTVIFGHDVSAMSKSLQAVSLALYWFTAIPIVNVLGEVLAVNAVGIVFFYLFKPLILRYLNRRHSTNSNTNNDGSSLWNRSRNIRRLFYLQFILFLDVLFAVDTELKIHRSRPLVQSGESQWTFGQTLAVIVTVIPVLEARKCIKWWRKPNRSQISLDYQGDAPLIVYPPIDDSVRIKKGNTAIVPDRKAYTFSVNGSVVASIRNHHGNNEIQIGISVEGKETFILTVCREVSTMISGGSAKQDVSRTDTLSIDEDSKW